MHFQRRQTPSRAVTFGKVPVLVALAFAMNPPPTEKTHKPRTVKPYTSEPGPRGPNAKNRPVTSAKPLKKRLTNSYWMEVYDWVDNHPHVTQVETAKYSATRPNGALTFDQGSPSRNLRERDQREAEVVVT